MITENESSTVLEGTALQVVFVICGLLEQGYNHWQSSEAELPPLESTVPTDKVTSSYQGSSILYVSLRNILHQICTTPQFPINCVHTIDHINMRIPLDGVRSCNSAVPRIFNGNQVPTREFHALCRKFQEELPQVHPGEGTELNEDDCG
ncbi:uncharacterized protein [Lolium perenne]|uniref:uncharacterized protein n=1 Tax=Lolium perenne TaxID=4522 RepID=UPI0021F69976|nr:uncharacterized protein LOC127294320 isoform X1 [Lolium perenne]XP_051180073.1 uncharacterized protein LOC127294320 isoform X1 [Lolium perenne]XP_051180074.1 uncharacterized protein LOC127294320 isoform X1 [Lolium perenne]XP_051180075.1 uncharacterized protein LOC127294320 isoform X1 [Lolium perenne]XP_051180076.1 uncharacterized protein LOC127294320 isoform X1 [Lolium perenne]